MPGAMQAKHAKADVDAARKKNELPGKGGQTAQAAAEHPPQGMVSPGGWLPKYWPRGSIWGSRAGATAGSQQRHRRVAAAS